MENGLIIGPMWLSVTSAAPTITLTFFHPNSFFYGEKKSALK